MKEKIVATLETLYATAESAGEHSLLPPGDLSEDIEYVCHLGSNKSGIRLVMACMVAVLDNPEHDPRMPYTEIGHQRCFSGRVYDEQVLGPLIQKHKLPCNSTTAFLTPALRNHKAPLTAESKLVGSPAEMYVRAIRILESVHQSKADPSEVVSEFFRHLIQLRNAAQMRIESMLKELPSSDDPGTLSAEEIVNLLKQHLVSPRTSRLPVLIVAAAYDVASKHLGEKCLELRNHLAADKQTGTIGDVEICPVETNDVITAYEMKDKPITITDINIAIEKMSGAPKPIRNYIFITTQECDDDVLTYAAEFYKLSGGIEIAILDCIQFARHFLHLFYDLRGPFLNRYQELLLMQPESAVRTELKEAFLTLRKAAESGD